MLTASIALSKMAMKKFSNDGDIKQRTVLAIGSVEQIAKRQNGCERRGASRRYSEDYRRLAPCRSHLFNTA